MEANNITLVPNGRLTEHTAHVDVRGDVPRLSYRNVHGRIVEFVPAKIVVTWQWSWITSGWYVLEIRVLGRNGNQDVKTVFRDPDKAPEWVQEAVRLSAPSLVPAPRTPIDDAGETEGSGKNA